MPAESGPSAGLRPRGESAAQLRRRSPPSARPRSRGELPKYLSAVLLEQLASPLPGGVAAEARDCVRIPVRPHSRGSRPAAPRARRAPPARLRPWGSRFGDVTSGRMVRWLDRKSVV